MSSLAFQLLDLVVISVVVFGLYLPRHGRADMVVAYLAVNIGVLAVAQTLDSRAGSAGLGLGLFGLLSIIRLRSTDIDHQEVAYYFGALTLGLLGGLTLDPQWVIPVLMGLIALALFVGDHPALRKRFRSQVITLDTAMLDEAALVARIESMMGVRVRRAIVRRVDLVEDVTVVEIRYSPGQAVPSASPAVTSTLG